MDLKTLSETPPWDRPKEAGRIILDTLGDRRAANADRLLAAELAGEPAGVDDERVEALLSILRAADEPEDLRSRAAIALGPALEDADLADPEDPEDSAITQRTFQAVQATLRNLYLDGGVPKAVRRATLEASVRAPQDWHQDAVRAAFSSGDADWRLTAVFCMQYFRGFDEQILEALKSSDLLVRTHAVSAAGAWQIQPAWPYVAALVASPETEKPLLLAAIDAVASIRPAEAPAILGGLVENRDEDIAEAVFEALGMAEGLEADYDDDDDDDDGDDDDGDDDDGLIR